MRRCYIVLGLVFVIMALLTVQALADTDPPVVVSYSLSAYTITAPGSIEISAMITDESEIQSAWCDVYPEGGGMSKGTRLVYDSANSTWKGTVFFEEYVAEGNYNICFTVSDVLGNNVNKSYGDAFYVSNPNADVSPPELVSYSLSQTEIQAPQSVDVSAQIIDAASGVTDVICQACPVISSNFLQISLSYQAGSGRWEGTFQFSENAPAGSYDLVFQTLDNAGNFGDHTVPDALFVNSSQPDDQPPQLISFTLGKTSAKPMETIPVHAEISDNLSGIAYASVTSYPKGVSGIINPIDTALTYNESTGVWDGAFYVQADALHGEYGIIVCLSDNAGNFSNLELNETFYVEHTYDLSGSSPHTCTICGYVSEHDFSGADPHVCTICGYVSPHDFSGAKNACSICGIKLKKIETEPIVISGIDASDSKIKLGGKIVWTATAIGGSGPLTYRFELYKDKKCIAKGEYSQSNIFEYTPEIKGKYKVVVYVSDGVIIDAKDSGSTVAK
jgi:hypothetical protein